MAAIGSGSSDDGDTRRTTGLSLRSRLLAGMVVVAIVLVGMAVVITRTTQTYLLDQVDAQLVRAGGPAGFGGNGPPPGNVAPTDPDRPTDGLSSVYVAVIDTDGSVDVLATPRLTGADPPLPRIDVDEARTRAADRETFTADTDEDGQRYRIIARQDPRSDDIVLIGQSLADVDDAVSRLVVVEVVATLLVLAVLSLVTWWVIRLGVRPIKRMTAAASTIAAGDLSERVPAAADGTEAGELGTALNHMLGRIETAFDERAESEERLRRFIADASHELRTPVTTIRGYSELYRHGGLADSHDLDEAMRRTEEEATRMGNLVNDLLQLARLDQGRPLEQQVVRLDALVDDAVRDARAVQPERTITSDSTAVSVIGDEERLRQVLANILSNALAHTPVDAAIEVGVGVDPSGDRTQVLLQVTDHGPGMTPEAIEHAFERFFRADPSRSRHQGGSGLGLSIVDAIVAAHGGSVEITSDPGVRTTVSVRLPVAP